MTVSGAVTNATGAIVVPCDGDLSVFPKAWRATGALLRTKQSTDKPLKVGETLEGFASTLGKGPKFLAVTTRNGLRSVIPLTGPFFKLPLEADLAPNFSLTVYGFEGARLRSSDLTYDVEPPPDLKVEATRFAETVRPGSKQTWEIAVDDPNAELLVTCYDKALDEIRPYVWTTLAARFPTYLNTWNLTRDWFWPNWLTAREPIPWDFCAPGHEHRVPMFHWPFEEEEESVTEGLYGARFLGDWAAAPRAANVAMDAVAAEEAAPIAAKSAGGNVAAPTPPPRMRTDFAKTALWAPQKRLENGKAVFTFTLPDTLTTWKLMAFAFTPDGRSGTLTRDCQARLDVMLQPYLPRVLRVGDRLTLNVRLANTTDKPLDTWATLNRGERKPVTLPPKGAATVSWDVVAQAVPGTQTFEFATEGDAVRLDLPVLDNRVRVEDVYPLTLVDTEPTTVDVLEPTVFDELAVRWDHTPAAAVAESLAKVPDWPYESSDQLFANLAASLLLREMKAPLANADAREEEWLNRLLAAKRGDLWPWFPGGPEDVYATAEICLGTARLHRLGLAPKPLEEAVLATLKAKPKTLSFAAWAYTRSAFLDVWPQEEDLTDSLLLAYREAKGVQERRLLAVAAKRLGVKAVAEAGLKDVTDAINASKTWGVWWPQERLWWVWWGTPIESHVLGLETLLENGRAEDARAAARWLLQHRRLNGWGNTRATLAAAFGLRLVGTPETEVGAIPTIRHTSDNRPGVRRLVYARSLPGLSFGSVVAAYTLPLDQVPAPEVGEDAALTLTRTYAPARPKVGDTVTVTLRITAAQPMSHAWLRDEHPRRRLRPRPGHPDPHPRAGLRRPHRRRAAHRHPVTGRPNKESPHRLLADGGFLPFTPLRAPRARSRRERGGSDEPVVGGGGGGRLGGREEDVGVGGEDLDAVGEGAHADGLDGADGAGILATAAADAEVGRQRRDQDALGVGLHAEGAGGAVLGAGAAGVLGGEGHADGGLQLGQADARALLDGEVEQADGAGGADLAALGAVVLAHARVEDEVDGAGAALGAQDAPLAGGHAPPAVGAFGEEALGRAGAGRVDGLVGGLGGRRGEGKKRLGAVGQGLDDDGLAGGGADGLARAAPDATVGIDLGDEERLAVPLDAFEADGADGAGLGATAAVLPGVGPATVGGVAGQAQARAPLDGEGQGEQRAGGADLRATFAIEVATRAVGVVEVDDAEGAGWLDGVGGAVGDTEAAVGAGREEARQVACAGWADRALGKEGVRRGLGDDEAGGHAGGRAPREQPADGERLAARGQAEARVAAIGDGAEGADRGALEAPDAAAVVDGPGLGVQTTRRADGGALPALDAARGEGQAKGRMGGDAGEQGAHRAEAVAEEARAPRDQHGDEEQGQDAAGRNGAEERVGVQETEAERPTADERHGPDRRAQALAQAEEAGLGRALAFPDAQQAQEVLKDAEGADHRAVGTAQEGRRRQDDHRGDDAEEGEARGGGEDGRGEVGVGDARQGDGRVRGG